MCGIIAYKRIEDSQQIKQDAILEGLKSLEYRGYDSWGIATVDSGCLKLTKKIGKIGKVSEIKNTGLAIGHTRWATHGSVTEQNAHPHISNNKKIAVAHNGIIENYQDLQAFLETKGFVLESETDTEVIPNLIEYYMAEHKEKYDFIEATKKALKLLEGSYAVAIIDAESDVLIGARHGSPLVLGIGDKEFFIASDIPAFMQHTKKVMYLNDGDFVTVNNGINVYNLFENKQVQRDISTIEWNIEQVKKGNFEHYMLKEISEQAETIQKAISQPKEIIQEIANEIKEAKGVFFVACGSSYHACLSASYIFSKIAQRHVNVVLGSEFSNHDHFLTDKSLVIAVSQSGETADVLEAVKAAKQKKAKVISIVNVMGSSLVRNSDKALMMHAGPEICVLSTKTYTSQLAILCLLAFACSNRFEQGKAELKELYNTVYNLTSVNMRSFLKTIAEKLRYTQHIFLIGRGLQYPTALEAALKIKEVSYIHAEGFAGGELKHGTIALIEHATPTIVFTTEETEREVISNAMEIKARGAYIIGIGPRKNEIFDIFIKVQEGGNLNSILQIIPVQILAYQLAVLRGCDPDKPRNLAKSVTVK